MFCQVTAAQEWDFFANKIEFECTVPCFQLHLLWLFLLTNALWGNDS